MVEQYDEEMKALRDLYERAGVVQAMRRTGSWLFCTIATALEQAVVEDAHAMGLEAYTADQVADQAMKEMMK